MLFRCGEGSRFLWIVFLCILEPRNLYVLDLDSVILSSFSLFSFWALPCCFVFVCVCARVRVCVCDVSV